MLKRLFLLGGFIAMATGAVFFLRPVPVAHAQNPPCTPGPTNVCGTEFGPLGAYNTGYSSNQVATWITGDTSLVNPANCTDVTDGYLTSTIDASMLQSALLGALLGGKKVQLVIEGCTLNRPQIIAVNIQP